MALGANGQLHAYQCISGYQVTQPANPVLSEQCTLDDAQKVGDACASLLLDWGDGDFIQLGNCVLPAVILKRKYQKEAHLSN